MGNRRIFKQKMKATFFNIQEKSNILWFNFSFE